MRLGKRGGMRADDSLLQRGAGGVAVEDRQTLPEAAPIPEQYANESCFTFLCTDWCGPARDDSPASSQRPSRDLSRVAEVGRRARHGRMVERALTRRLAAFIHEIACPACIAVSVRVNILALSGISCGMILALGPNLCHSPTKARGVIWKQSRSPIGLSPVRNRLFAPLTARHEPHVLLRDHKRTPTPPKMDSLEQYSPLNPPAPPPLPPPHRWCVALGDCLSSIHSYRTWRVLHRRFSRVSLGGGQPSYR